MVGEGDEQHGDMAPFEEVVRNDATRGVIGLGPANGNEIGFGRFDGAQNLLDRHADAEFRRALGAPGR